MGVVVGTFVEKITGETSTIQVHAMKNFSDEGEYELTFENGILISAIKYA